MALILQIQNIKTQMYHICNFVAFSFYSEIIKNPDNLLTHLLLICFRPSKFEWAVMDFYNILWNFIFIFWCRYELLRYVICYKIICYDLNKLTIQTRQIETWVLFITGSFFHNFCWYYRQYIMNYEKIYIYIFPSINMLNKSYYFPALISMLNKN